jgi:ABC-type nitrate/sulfonate/bicarbonate transport system permease component
MKSRALNVKRGVAGLPQWIGRLEKRSLMKQILIYATSIAVLLFFWQMVSLAVNGINHIYLLPGPYPTLSQVVKNAAELFQDFLISAWRLVFAILIALAISVPSGLIIGRERFLDRFISPMSYITYPIPQVALLLVLFLIFGTGNATMVAIVTLVLLFQILVSARGAATNIDEEHIISVLSAGASRWQVYWHVVLPASLPAILTSVRVSIGLGVTLLYIAETTVTGGGLGDYIKDHMLFGREYAFAGIIVLAVLGLLLYVVIEVLERLLCRWKYARRRPL